MMLIPINTNSALNGVIIYLEQIYYGGVPKYMMQPQG
jgi:hypothetical protein